MTATCCMSTLGAGEPAYTPGGWRKNSAVAATARGHTRTTTSVGTTVVVAVVDQSQRFVGFVGLEMGADPRLGVGGQQSLIQELGDGFGGPSRLIGLWWRDHCVTPASRCATVLINMLAVTMMQAYRSACSLRWPGGVCQ